VSAGDIRKMANAHDRSFGRNTVFPSIHGCQHKQYSSLLHLFGCRTNLARSASFLHFMINNYWTGRALHDLRSAFESKQAPQKAWMVARCNNQISVPCNHRKPNFLRRIPNPKLRLTTRIYSTHFVAETDKLFLCSIAFSCLAPMDIAHSEFRDRFGRKHMHEYDRCVEALG